MVSLSRRMQPLETSVPRVEGSSVPWTAREPSPPPNSVRMSENPDSPKANGPYGPFGSGGWMSSVTK